MKSDQEQTPSLKESLLKQFMKLRGMSAAEFAALSGFLQLTPAIASSLTENDGLSFEGLKLLVHIEKLARKAKGENFDCHVIHIDQLTQFLSLLVDPKNIPYQGKRRIQVIVGVGKEKIHYASCDFELSKKERVGFLLDAANGFDMLKIQAVLNKACDEDLLTRYIWAKNDGTTGNPQRDFNTCPVHAFYHAKESSKLAQLFNLIKRNANSRSHFQAPNGINWMKLPPELVALAEKAWFLKKYLDHTDNNAYTKSNPGFANLIMPSLGYSFNDVMANTQKLNDTGILPAWEEFKKFYPLVKEFLNKVSEEELKEIINQPLAIQNIEGPCYADWLVEFNAYQEMLRDLEDLLGLGGDSDDESESFNDNWSPQQSKDWQSIHQANESNAMNPPTMAETSNNNNIVPDKENFTIMEIKVKIVEILNRDLSFAEKKAKLTSLLLELLDTYEKNPAYNRDAKELKEFIATHLANTQTEPSSNLNLSR